MWDGTCNTMMSSANVQAAPVIAIVAGHGAFAMGMISAVERISGAGQRFHAVSNESLAPDALTDALRTSVQRTGATVIFTDLPAGSCTTAARRVAREISGLAVIAGANLPILLHFALVTDFDGAAIAPAVIKARDAMVSFVEPAAR